MRSKKKKKATAAAAADVVLSAQEVAPPAGDEWSTVAAKSKSKSQKKKKTTSHESASNAAATKTRSVDLTSKAIEVPSKKIGTIIGSKGTTINAIKDRTNCEIDVQDRDAARGETTTVTITGEAEDVAYAAKIITDTVKKNYCALMKGENFKETSIVVPVCFHPTLIGSKGVMIKKLKEIGNGIEISMPDKTRGGKRVKLGGDSADLERCKAAIDDLMKYTHSAILEPSKTHIEISVPETKLGRVIGPKGANVRHIQGTTGATVRTPDRRLGEFMNKNVILIGTQSQVNAAKKMIESTLAEEAAEAEAAAARQQAQQAEWDAKSADEKTEISPSAWEAPTEEAEEDGW
jgi:polyribonucleotide nucleotidyltransferase